MIAYTSLVCFAACVVFSSASLFGNFGFPNGDDDQPASGGGQPGGFGGYQPPGFGDQSGGGPPAGFGGYKPPGFGDQSGGYGGPPAGFGGFQPPGFGDQSGGYGGPPAGFGGYQPQGFGDQSGGYGEDQSEDYGDDQPAGFGDQPGYGIPPFPQVVAVNGSSIWMYDPVDDSSYPTFAQNLGNNTDGETMTDFCQYVVQNKALPFTLPSDSSNDNNNVRRIFYNVQIMLQFCSQMLQNDGVFYVPADIYNRLDFFA